MENPDNLEVKVLGWNYAEVELLCFQLESISQELHFCHTFSPPRFGALSMARDVSMATPGQAHNAHSLILSSLNLRLKPSFSGTWSSLWQTSSPTFLINSPWALVTLCSQALLQVRNVVCQSPSDIVMHYPTVVHWHVFLPRSGTGCCWRCHHCWSWRPGHHHLSCSCLNCTDVHSLSFSSSL